MPHQTNEFPQPRLGGELQQGEASHSLLSVATSGRPTRSRGGITRGRTSPIVGPIRSMLRVAIAVFGSLNRTQCSALGVQCSRSDVGLGVLAHLADFPCAPHAKSTEDIQTLMTWKKVILRSSCYLCFEKPLELVCSNYLEELLGCPFFLVLIFIFPRVPPCRNSYGVCADCLQIRSISQYVRSHFVIS